MNYFEKFVTNSWDFENSSISLSQMLLLQAVDCHIKPPSKVAFLLASEPRFNGTESSFWLILISLRIFMHCVSWFFGCLLCCPPYFVLDV
jgi:hypothetical protein